MFEITYFVRDVLGTKTICTLVLPPFSNFSREDSDSVSREAFAERLARLFIHHGTTHTVGNVPDHSSVLGDKVVSISVRSVKEVPSG